MKRKLVQQGPTTLMVSLPTNWIKKHGYKKGDEIEINEKDANLVVGGKQEAVSEASIHIESKKLPLDEDKYPDRYVIRTIVINALRKGHDKIRITFDSPDVLYRINSCVGEVLGYEITEQSSNSCLVEAVAALKDVDLAQYFTKFRQVLSNFAHLVQLNIIEGADNFEEIKSAFLMIEKNYNNLCIFIMHDCQNNTKEKLFLFEAIGHLYQASRNLFYAAKLHNEQTNVKLKKPFIEYYKRIFEYIDNVLKFISSKNLASIAELNVEKNMLTYHEMNKIVSQNSKESPIAIQLSFAARRMWDSVGPYVGSII